MIISKEKFTLREFNINDFKDVHEYSNDIKNLKYTLWGPNKEEETIGFIKNSIRTSNENPRVNYEFAIEINTEEGIKVIGGCGLYIIDNFLVGEVGWIINRKYWGIGYGTLVGAALLEFGFNEINLNKIFATCDSRNIGSYRIMEKCNMIRESLKIGVRPSREIGKFEDELNYYILKEEYMKIRD